MGAFFVVRAVDLYKCGLFDPNTFLYMEEEILSERMKSIDKGAYYYPEVTVIHAHGVSTKKYIKNKMNNILFESEYYYYRKYMHTNLFLLYLGRITCHLVNIKDYIKQLF